MRQLKWIFVLPIALVALSLLTSSFVFAQEGPSEDSMQVALEDLSAIYGSPVVRVDQARAICNQEQYMVECANIGKKHGLFPKEREREVDAILSKVKGKVVDELKRCGDTDCLITVAARIARELSTANPTLAREVDLTPQDVQEKRSIIEASKSVGVDIDECRTMDPDTASVELLRSCAKLAKHESIQQYIPEEERGHVEKTEKTAELKEALAAGEIACGDGTLEGCGKFCLNTTAPQREEGLSAIPAICRQIAEQFFGPEGVQDLERTYGTVRQTYDEVREMYRQRGEDPEDVPPIDRARLLPGITCPTVENTPCPTGHYRQGSVNEFGCYVRSACVPFNTETQPEWKEKDKKVICPAMPTVDSCPEGEEKVGSYSSPECGTYYMCRPKPKDHTTKFPHTFGSGRVVVSYDEARIYCYESGPKGATLKGDKEECFRAFGISVPDIPPEKQCPQYGAGWHSMDGSGNCFNEQMTEYRTPAGVIQTCSVAPVYGCMEKQTPIEPPGGQKEQVWNSLGLRSWIRGDASESRIAELKAACAKVPSGANVWMPGAGTFESKDFGMPDLDKCRKATSCTSSQHFDGTECKEQSQTPCPAGHYWNGTTCTGGDPVWDMQRCFYKDATKNGDYIGYTVWCESDYNNCHEGSPSGASISLSGVSLGAPSQCESGGESTQCSDGKDNDNDGKIDYPNDKSCSDKYGNDESYPGRTGPQCPAGQYWDGAGCRGEGDIVSGSCSSDIKTLLGSGCHSMGTAWFNQAMTLYILPGSAFVKSCASAKISGCSGTHTAVTCPPKQFWNGSSCVSSEGTICAANEYWDSGKGTCMSSARACASAGGSWDSEKAVCDMTPSPPPLSSIPTTPPTQGTPECKDGKDNDSDGKIDYPADTGCYGADDWSEAYESTTGNQKTQVWNNYGLQSMIRADADPARIETLKGACANVRSSSNIWMPSAGTYSSNDFGMPDPGKCAQATSCASDQYFNGSSCTSTSGGGGSAGGGGGSMQRCFYTNATRNGSPMGYSVWCESDYYNCHEGSQSGTSISLSGVSLGAPSQCESGWTNSTIGSECRGQTSQSTCSAVSGCYWYTGYSGSYCDSSGSAATSGSGTGTSGGLGCYTYSSQSSCQSVSGCYWVTPSGGSPGCSDYPDGGSGSPGGYGSSSSCGSNEYWDTRTSSCQSMQSACAEAGGSWDGAANYCVMPGTSSGYSGSSSSCPSGQYWNGSACAPSESTSATSCPSDQYWNGTACAPMQTTPDYSQMQSDCAAAGGSWDSSSNYCSMPTASAGGSFAYLCPPDHVWTGSYCTYVEQKGISSFVASVIQAFMSLFSR